MPTSENYNPDVLSCLANLSSDEVFTSPQLVNQMLDLLPPEIWGEKEARFLDPVCKTGVFLREIAKRLDKGLQNKITDKQERINHIFSNQLFGIAITELTALLSRRSVYCSKTANGKYSVCESFDAPEGNIHFERIEHTWDNGRCAFCGANEIKYERGKDYESYAYKFIHTENPQEIFNMKFDVIVGNPPYQLNVGMKKENYAIPLYHKFVEQAKKLNPRYITMIIPSRWFTGGRGLDDFRNSMLNDKHLKAIVDYADSKDCFPGVDVAGGVMYFLWDNSYLGKCEFTNIHNGKYNTLLRELNEFSIFPRYNEAISIIHNISSKKGKSLSVQISAQTPFGLYTNFKGEKIKSKNSVAVVSSSGVTYIKKNQIQRNQRWIKKYKVIISKATSEHAGQSDKSGQFKVLSTIRVLKPDFVCTQSYLVAGVFDDEKAAKNLYSYLHTKFTRFLLLQSVTSQDLSKDKFRFVPIQNFNENWTDGKLYKKYNLTEDEIAFIESMVRPMETENNEG